MIWAVRIRRGLGWGALLLPLVLILAPIVGVMYADFLLSLRDDVGMGWLVNRLALIGKLCLIGWIAAWLVTWCVRLRRRGAR